MNMDKTRHSANRGRWRKSVAVVVTDNLSAVSFVRLHAVHVDMV